MAVAICYDQSAEVACLYDTTSDHAFGPIFTGPEAELEADEFLEWLALNAEPVSWAVASPQIGDGKDPRDYTADELERVVRHWRQLREDGGDGREPDGQRVEGGRIVPTDR